MTGDPIDVWAQDRDIYVQAPYDLKDDCRMIPGAEWVRQYGVWRYPATPAVAGAILEVFGPHGARYTDRLVELADRWDMLTKRQAAQDTPWPQDMTLQPWSHQIDAYRAVQGFLGRKAGAAGLFAGMGTGKTLVATAVLAERKWERVLIVAPLNMLRTWEKELTSRIEGSPYAVVVLTGSTKQKAQMVDFYRRDGEPTIFITNYQSVWRPELRDALEADPPDAILLDEAQAIKAPGSKVSQFLYRLGRRADFRIALTGTPVHDKLSDIYGLYRFLDPGIFGTNYDRFLDDYAVRIKMPGGFSIIRHYTNIEDMSERMYRIAFRVTEDVLDLPEAVDTTVPIDLSPSALKTYATLEKKLVVDLDEGTVVAGNVLTKLLRLQQMTGGFLPLESEDGTTTKRVDKAKEDALYELLTSIPEDEPVVVFAKFRDDLDVIYDVADKAGRLCFEESGKKHDWDFWQNEDENGSVLAVQVDAGSSGINLTRSAYAIYYSLGYSLGNYEQSRRRVLRPGQTRPVRYYHLLARDTVDEQVMSALQAKRDVARYVVEELGKD